MLLVDEAGSAGTIELDALRSIAVERGAVIRLVGDYRQSGSPAAGGALRLLAGELGAPELLEVHRFTDPVEAAASLALRGGDQDAVDFYLAAGRAHEVTDLDRVERAYAAWKADSDAGRSSLMMAKSNETVGALNDRARGALLSSGAVCGDQVDLRDGRHAAVGDVVLSRKNDTTIQVGARGHHALNGQLWHVVGVNPDRSLQVHLVGGKVVTTLPSRYVADHVELGYACTIDRAKGTTVDTGHAVVEPGMTREDLYVAVSRGREANHVYVPVEYHLGVDAERAPESPTDADTVLRDIVAREGAQLSATETMREEMDAPGRLDVLVPQYADTVDRLGKTAVVAAAEQARPALDPPLPWLPPVPQGPADGLRENAAIRAARIADRAAELAGRVDVERPSWARPLGDRPAEPAQARDWDRASVLAAAYREQFGVDGDDQVLGDRVDVGSRGRAWQSADDAVRTVCPRRFSEVSDRKLAESISVWQRQQDDAVKWKADAEKAKAEPGTFTKAAERKNEAARADWTAARTRADALRAEVEQTRQKIDQRQAELDAAGRFAGGKRRALSEEIATLKATQQARIAALKEAEARAEELRLRAELRLVEARERDERALTSAQSRADKAEELAAASRESLYEALDEQAYRERNGIQVDDDPAVLAQEQAEREQALQQQREQQLQRSARMDEVMAQTQTEAFGI